MSDARVADMPKVKFLARDHIPNNKARWQVSDSCCEVTVQDYDGTGPSPNAWTTIELAETYTPDGSNRPVSRTISVQLDPVQRSKLIAMLTRA